MPDEGVVTERDDDRVTQGRDGGIVTLRDGAGAGGGEHGDIQLRGEDPEIGIGISM